MLSGGKPCEQAALGAPSASPDEFVLLYSVIQRGGVLALLRGARPAGEQANVFNMF